MYKINVSITEHKNKFVISINIFLNNLTTTFILRGIINKLLQHNNITTKKYLKY